MGHHRSDPLVPSPPHMADKAGAHRPREGLVKLVRGHKGWRLGCCSVHNGDKNLPENQIRYVDLEDKVFVGEGIQTIKNEVLPI